MIRVAYYSKPGKPFLVKIIRRGFACTSNELWREIQTACGQGAKLLSHELYSSEAAAKEVIKHCRPEWKTEGE